MTFAQWVEAFVRVVFFGALVLFVLWPLGRLSAGREVSRMSFREMRDRNPLMASMWFFSRAGRFALFVAVVTGVLSLIAAAIGWPRIDKARRRRPAAATGRAGRLVRGRG